MSIAPKTPRAVRSDRRATASLGAALALLILSAPTFAQETERVSVDSAAVEGNGQSALPSISGDGRYVAFASRADNLVPGDTNDASDVFVHDRLTMDTERVSVDSAGVDANGWSEWPSISLDGRYVTFESYANNLVPGDNNGERDIFVHDRLTRETTRVSVDSDGNEGNGDGYYSSISVDGRYVAFGSSADNLVPGDNNGEYDIFVHDRVTFETTRVSVDSGGNEGNGYSASASISGDGRCVAFYSRADNLVPGDTNGSLDIFVHDRLTRETTRVSVDSEGVEANRTSYLPSISGDGRFVAFDSGADNLVPGDTNGKTDVFVHDRLTMTTTRVSVDSGGVEGNDSSAGVSISGDGRYVAFFSNADNLVPGDTNGHADVFVHGPYLTLEADPETVGAGERIVVTTYTGMPGGLVFLVLVDVNGMSTFKLLLRGAFDSAGIRAIDGWIPHGLSGTVITLKSLGFAPNQKPALSNPEAITFQ